MRIIFGADAIQPGLTGIGRYALALGQGLMKSSEIKSVYFYAHGKLFSNPDVLLEKNYAITTIKKIRSKLFRPLRPLRIKINAWLLNKKINGLEASLYHSPNYILQEIDLPSVATIHDFSWMHYPEFHPKERLDLFERYFSQTVKRASHFITDSEFVRQELVKLFGVNQEKITAIPLGVDSYFKPRGILEVQDVLQKYQLGFKSYFLAVSTVEPRKNLHNLIKGFLQLPMQLRIQYPLVLVGSKGWLSSELHQDISRLQAQGCLKYLGYVPENDLPKIYAAAGGFAFPSIYEGFGLPMLEAMASGVPVLTSASSSMLEIAEDGAILVDPMDVDQIAQGLQKLIQDEKWSSETVLKGIKIAARYTWEACIEKTIDVYKKIAL